MNYFPPFFVKSRVWTTDRQKAMHMSPLCNLHRQAQKLKESFISCFNSPVLNPKSPFALFWGPQMSSPTLNFFMWGNWDYRISLHLKLGLWDSTPFKIGIMGLHPIWNWDYGITGPPLWGPLYCKSSHATSFPILIKMRPLKVNQFLLSEVPSRYDEKWSQSPFWWGHAFIFLTSCFT